MSQKSTPTPKTRLEPTFDQYAAYRDSRFCETCKLDKPVFVREEDPPMVAIENCTHAKCPFPYRA